MNPNTMRHIDYWIGIPICFILSAWYKLQRVVGLKNPRYDEKPRNVLFIELAEMGSTVLAHPSMKRLKELYPDSTTYFLLFKQIASSMEILDAVPSERIFTLDSSNVFTLARDVLKFMIKARREKIDTTLNLEMFARFSAILSYLSGARKRAGFHAYHQEGLYIGNFLTHKVNYNPHIHTAYSFLSLVEALGSSPSERPLVKKQVLSAPLHVPKRRSSPEALDNIRGKLKKINPDFDESKKLVLINPNASKLIEIRKWPLQHYADLIKKLLQDEGVYIAITGVASEQSDAQYIIERVNDKRVMDMMGKTTLPELIDLYNAATVLVTNDSGPAHFASLTDVHIVVFFGPDTPKLYGPLSENVTVMYADYYCSPCVSAYNQRLSPCNNNLCLKNLPVEKAYAAVKAALER